MRPTDGGAFISPSPSTLFFFAAPVQQSSMNLITPAWIPTPVASIAARLHDASMPADRIIIERLVRDVRMRSVWTEMRKRVREKYRKTERFSHPVADNSLVWLQNYAKFCEQNAAYRRKHGDEMGATESEKEAAEMRSLCPQDAACVSLFGIMFAAATLGFRTTTAPEWQEWQRQVGATASPPTTFVIQRRRGDQRARACGVAIGNALQAVFGSPCYKLTATSTAVVLNIDRPPPGRVREWFRRNASRH